MKLTHVFVAAGAAVALTACGGTEITADQLAAAEKRAEAAEQRAEAAESTISQARAEAEGAKAAAEADLKADRAKLDADRAKLEERAKAVGAAEAEAAANTFAGDGVYIVNDDIQPGTYKSAGGDNCYWSRNNKDGGIIDNHLGSGPTVVVVKGSDFALEVNGCAPFTKTG